MNSNNTREGWLTEATEKLRPSITGAGYHLPETGLLRLSCGWPSSRALSKTKRKLAECWSYKASSDGSTNIFLSPFLETSEDVLAALVHELGHAALPHDKHGAPYKAYMKAVGLEGKATATHAGDHLTLMLSEVSKSLGPYPNSKLDKIAEEKKTQGTRMRKITCDSHEHETPLVLRGAKKTFENGYPLCYCGQEFVLEESEDET